MAKNKGPYPPVVVVALLLLEFALHKWLPLATLATPPWTALGWLFIAFGIGAVAAMAEKFRRAGTTFIPYQDSTALVQGGLYRFSRNPMYLGMLDVLLGGALLSGSLSPFLAPLLFVPVMNRFVIAVEERMLEETFGDEYRAYKQQVRRWL